ncbi:Beta-glucanase, GH16 family [Arachidicoccus rhizosphaerae]|uniref:Beta-glucanase, GH16 family n=1 Tax=Arachidicoccus rhizosphaerae TaxID=551991 RepID=A0A1H3WKR6_9BACT|nr:family 16 glycosylhydrolase [Arachidicoccus rhizosphaerae]SDZ87540.1 Beta-glucanase, GH16 family [Arachidicoccus rhizosphaerae]
MQTIKKQAIGLLITGTFFGLSMSCSKNIQPTESTQSSDLTSVSNSATLAAQTRILSTPAYKLIWSDEFNTDGHFDTSKWSFAPRGTVAWTKYLTSDTSYAFNQGGALWLRMDNAVIAGDNAAYHSGGINSSGKFNFTYGKIEVRAKFNQGQGSWPAIWMMPDEPAAYGGWPNSGEMDIMEHVNKESVVHQTLHNADVTNSSGGSTATHSASYNTSDYNLYTEEWTPTTIKYYVNNTLQYTYTKTASGGSNQWPYDQPFYIILNQSGGAGWPGAITDSDLPFTMQVDYVRVYKSSVLSNGDFETGSLSPWTTWGQTSTVVSTGARTGSYCIKETGTAETSIEQALSGLTPNTTYRFGGFAKVGAQGQSVSIGVKNYGGAAIGTAITSTDYTHGSVTFTTGATDSTATIYFYKAGNGTAWGDDFYVEAL